MASLYDALCVPDTATAQEIKQAYRDLAKRYHPDLPDNRTNQAALGMFRQIQEAYELLGDADKRKRYDAARKLLEPQPEPPDEWPQPAGFWAWASGSISIHASGSWTISGSATILGGNVASGSAMIWQAWSGSSWQTINP